MLQEEDLVICERSFKTDPSGVLVSAVWTVCMVCMSKRPRRSWHQHCEEAHLQSRTQVTTSRQSIALKTASTTGYIDLLTPRNGP